ncbi:hypothetical protein KP509_04G086200 [Ceratopteris richardii]|nr:hypothetical protein KP509_04G086200 [Ceratopteris richardii]
MASQDDDQNKSATFTQDDAPSPLVQNQPLASPSLYPPLAPSPSSTIANQLRDSSQSQCPHNVPSPLPPYFVTPLYPTCVHPASDIPQSKADPLSPSSQSDTPLSYPPLASPFQAPFLRAVPPKLFQPLAPSLPTESPFESPFNPPLSSPDISSSSVDSPSASDPPTLSYPPLASPFQAPFLRAVPPKLFQPLAPSLPTESPFESPFNPPLSSPDISSSSVDSPSASDPPTSAPSASRSISPFLTPLDPPLFPFPPPVAQPSSSTLFPRTSPHSPAQQPVPVAQPPSSTFVPRTPRQSPAQQQVRRSRQGLPPPSRRREVPFRFLPPPQPPPPPPSPPPPPPSPPPPPPSPPPPPPHVLAPPPKEQKQSRHTFTAPPPRPHTVCNGPFLPWAPHHCVNPLLEHMPCLGIAHIVTIECPRFPIQGPPPPFSDCCGAYKEFNRRCMTSGVSLTDPRACIPNNICMLPYEIALLEMYCQYQ